MKRWIGIISRVITGGAWGLFALTNVTLLFGMPVLSVWLQRSLLGLAFAATTWLLIRYSRWLAQWRVVGLIWLLYSAVRLLSVRLHASPIPLLRDNLALFTMLLATEAIWAGWFALLALAVRRDVSVAYIVISLALGALLMRALVTEAGGVLRFLSSEAAKEPLYHFSITEPLIMSLFCMGPLGFVTLLPHLTCLLVKELQGR